jgi:hypothetical protein
MVPFLRLARNPRNKQKRSGTVSGFYHEEPRLSRMKWEDVAIVRQESESN